MTTRDYPDTIFQDQVQVLSLRNEVQDEAQSLPRLRHPRSEDSVLKRSSRDSKARSFSYSELELPSSSLLQRFGSLTWRKKKSSAVDYHGVSPNASSSSRSHWSMGRLDRPAVGSDLDLKNRRPSSCIVESYSELSSKSSDQYSKQQYGGQKALEVSTSFDYLINDDEDYSPSYPAFKGENNQLQLSPLTFPEKLENEEDEESLPCWAESILKDYLRPENSTPDSQLYPLYDETHSLKVLEEDGNHVHYRSPNYHHLTSKDKILEQTSEKGIALNTDVVFNKVICPLQDNNTCTEIQKQNSQCQSQSSLNSTGQMNIQNGKSKNLIPLHTSMFSEDVTPKGSTETDFCQNIHLNREHNSTFIFDGIKYLHSSPTRTKPKETTGYHKSPNGNSLQQGIQETIQSQGKLVQDAYKNEDHNLNRQIQSNTAEEEGTYNLPELHTTVQENIKGRTSPNIPKIKYQVIITMTKEEKEQSQLSAMAQELVKGDELVEQDLKLSSSLESQACGYHGAGAREVIAQSLSETSEQPEKKTAQKEEIPKKRRSFESFEGEHMERSLSLEADEDCPPTNPGSEQYHPEKIHGKLNPRPGKIILFSEPGFRGHRYQIYNDVGNMSDWELQGTVSICIVRGGWLLYEKPQFRGKRVMLTEGDTDLSCPWETDKATSENISANIKKPKFWIGSLRHVVRDFQVPQISLFMEENGEGNKVTIIGATSDSRVHGHPIKTESIIVHSGLWLVYSKPFFEGDPYILEPGGYPNRKAWNGKDSHLCSLQPARIGGPTVEKPNEPKIFLFKYPGFEGPIWEVSKDLNCLQDELNSKREYLLTVGSIRVLGGCWIAYEKKGFHGHQYLLEEGAYKDWSMWGGCSEELGSLRHIRTDFSEPEIVLYEKPGCSDGPCLRLNEALSDIELAQYETKTESIHVMNGVWVAYENVDFSGQQYILEKGIYHSYQDWGANDSRICSVQPVLQVGGQSLQYSPKIQLFSEPNFHGDCKTFVEDRSLIPESFSMQSCRVEGGCWSLYEGEECCGEQYILSEGDYPTRTAIGCQGFSTIRSLKRVPLYFSMPSISLHGLEKFEGKKLNFRSEIRSLQGEGYNNHVLSIRVKSGIWVLYEHSDFRGRQWLLECTQIPNWLLYSGLQRIGSFCPIRQRRVYFRIRNRVLGLFLCVPEPSEDMKAARVQLSKPQEGSCDLWFYEEGRIKNQLVPQMSLQVIGAANQGTKVVLWSEERKPVQTWTLEDSGYIVSCLFKGLCLDIKGGPVYDSNHVVVWEVSEDRPTQRWDLKVY